MGDTEAKRIKQELESSEQPGVDSAIRQEVQEIKEAVNEVVTETSLSA